MPPKRTAHGLTKVSTLAKTKLEDAHVETSAKKPFASSLAKRAALDSDDDASGPNLRRSPRKRVRVDLRESDDDDSSLTSMEPEEVSRAASEDECVGPSSSVPPASMKLERFAFTNSRPTRQTPSKLKVEEPSTSTSPFPKDEDSKPDLGGKKTKDGAHKASSAASPSKKPKNTSPRKQKPIVMELDTPHPTPDNWRKQYTLIEEMRAELEAPVDTMGCASSMTGQGPLKDQRFGTLVSLMLSSQTKDEVTAAAVDNLRAVLPGGLTVSSLLAADPSVISGAIGKVGFWRRKTEYLQKAAAIVRDKFDGDVPQTIDELCSLPGVGPKMAFLVLQVAWKINAGIGVDVHVQRITNRLGWHKPPTTTPEQTRLNLQSWLPRELHGPINPLLVGFGQIVCLPVGPRCDVCTLSVEGLCPSARTGVSAKGKKAIVFKRKGDGKMKAEDCDPGAVPTDLDAAGLVRFEEVKKEEAMPTEEGALKGVGEPRIQIKLEE
ncbi:DNA glycosylase [Ceratobasidium sp. AG-I]|nr:DNA glycosylase [Ceratobasidium sp. AG-I]